MPYIIVKKNDSWKKRKDFLHKKRKEIAENLKPGMFSVSQMKKGESQFLNHREQVAQYDKWKEHNRHNMQAWGDINREFKSKGEEGRIHTLDDIRNNKVKYD